MNNRSITRALILLSIAGLMTIGGSSSQGQSDPAKQSFNVSKYGTLLEVFDEKGQSRFGKLTKSGFQLTYQYKGGDTTVSALGTEEAKGLVAGSIKADGQSTTVTTTTSDQVLEITTHFFVEENTKKLIVQRVFTNISAQPVVVSAIDEYLDPALVVSGGLTNNTPTVKLAGLVASQLDVSRILWDCKCPKVPDPCPPLCPEKMYFDLGKMNIRTNPPDNRLEGIELSWRGSRSLESSANKTTLQKKNVSAVTYRYSPRK